MYSMTLTALPAPSTGKSLLTYLAYFVGIAVLLNVIMIGLVLYTNIELSSSALGWVPPIIAAMQTGQAYGRRTLAKPAQRYSWLMGLLFVGITFAVGSAFALALAQIDGTNVMAVLGSLQREMQRDGDGAMLFFGIMGVFVLIMWVGLRFSFSTGAVQGIKMAEKLAAKGK
jgi:hypothetical protein